jgi:hypothetical protein
MDHPEKKKDKDKTYYWKHKKELLQKWREKRDEMYKYQKEFRIRRRSDVLSHYGGICQCCGESTFEFLCIDHINGGGNKHRLEVLRGTNFYSWLKKNNYPTGYQVLCHNCNMAKGMYGKCPHEKQKSLL